jgi:Domain of unknown function (DUF4918)
LSFYSSLDFNVKLPKGIEVMNPYHDEYTLQLCKKFYHQYYSDKNERFLILGINPGRFGSGTTGISFTDPIKLETECGIANTLPKKAELSADFIYKMIHAYGGVERFYKYYFISAVSPLGFTKEGKNINYYDDVNLQKNCTPFVISAMETILSMPISRATCFCLGEGKNYEYLKKLNQQQQWFNEIVPLAHPRFIMQYKRKSLSTYISDYIKKLSA